MNDGKVFRCLLKNEWLISFLEAFLLFTIQFKGILFSSFFNVTETVQSVLQCLTRRAWLEQMINLYYSKAVSCSSEEMSGERMEECGEKWEARRRRSIICSILLLCCAGALQGILVNGLINVVISTIEKRLIS